MFDVLKGWMDRYFSNEEAVLLLFLLLSTLIIVLTMGKMLAPALTAFVIAYVMQGMIVRLKKYKVPEFPAVMLTFLLFVGALLAVLLVIFPLVVRQLTNLVNEVPGMVTRAQGLLLSLQQEYPQWISQTQIESAMQVIGGELASLGQQIVSYSLSSIPVVIGILIYLVLVPILVFFCLKDRKQLIDWFVGYLPKKRPLISQVMVEVNQQVTNYIRGKAIEILIIGGVSYITFAILGLNYAALLGLLMGLSVIIPFVGVVVVTIPLAMIAYFQWGFSSEFYYLMIAHGIIQALDGNVLVPWLFSEAVNLHPIAIILSILVFGGLWGVWGVFFAIPLATVVKALLDAWPSGTSSVNT